MPDANSPAPEPLAEDRVEKMWAPVAITSYVALIGNKSVEGVLQGRARDPVFRCDAAPGRGLTVGQRNEHDALHATDSVPDGLMCVARLGYRKIECGQGGIVGRGAAVEDVVEVVGEQDSSLRMTAGDRKKLVDGTVIAETISLQQLLDIPSRLVQRQGWKFKGPSLTIEGPLAIREQ